MATGASSRAEKRAELLNKAAEYRNTAMQLQEPGLTAEYLRMATAAEQEAEGLQAVEPRRVYRPTRGTR